MLLKSIFTLFVLSMTLFSEVSVISNEKMLMTAIEENQIVVVDYYADWCGPCKLLGPILKELSEEYDSQVAFFKVNVDEQKRLAAQAEIRSIPYVLFFKDGSAVHGQTGLLEKDQYKKILDYIISTDLDTDSL